MKDIEASYDKVVAQIRAQYSLGVCLHQHEAGRQLAEGRNPRRVLT